ncbi:NADPH-dependent F420 reductase [Candidatus Bathyarchaeota archaeon]|nr:MAG: NADPH-dependent F420 reductase [archaeon 13_1_20CM_52_20]TMI49778.1 MAG: NADPH-dependent F420 reductase [Candidatus Bathyarchaeota archaeon]TMI59234.1 MAG: NADPH-dependent F420 reductase [Candidatus Bathyarchaeota archaeon]
MAVLGGAGEEGFGLALRWAMAGHQVIVGSRSPDRAAEAAKTIAQTARRPVRASGSSNESAVSQADVIVVTVPFTALLETLKTVKPSFKPGQVLVNVSVPLETAVGGRATRTVGVWAGSAGELAASVVPKTVSVVTAFNNVSAELLRDPSKPVDCDILVCSNDDNAKKIVLDLVKSIGGARGFDAGALENSRTVEQITALLVSLNIRYKVKSAGLRITGISLVS